MKELYIVKCDGLEYIFPALMARQELPELENLRIHDCPQSKQAVRRKEGRDAPRPVQFLTELSVSACPLLTDSFVHLKVEKAILKVLPFSPFLVIELNLCLVPNANGEGLNG